MSSVRKRYVPALALTAAVALLLGACGKKSEEPTGANSSPAGDTVTIEYLHRLPDGAGMTKVADIVKKWNAENPKIQVKATKFDGKAADLIKKLDTDVKAKAAPCLAQVGYGEIPDTFVKGLLEDVTSEAGKYNDKFSAGAVSLMTVGGKQVGLPQDGGPLVYFYNKAEFEKLGIKAPTTWDEFTTAAETAAKGGKYIAAFLPDEVGFWLAGQSTAAGAKWYSAADDKWTVKTNDEATGKVDALWQKLLDNKAVLVTDRWGDGFNKAIADQQLIGTVGAAWEAALIAGDHKDNANAGNWAVAPLPSFDGKPTSGPDGGSGVAVIKGCAHKAEAMQFNAWFNTQINDLATQGLVVTAKGNVTTPDALKKFFGGQEVMNELAKANESMKEMSYIPGFPAVSAAMGKKGAEVGKGNAKVADITATAQTESVSALEAAGLPVAK